MTDEDKAYFDNYLDMFTHPGWQQLLIDMADARDAIDRGGWVSATTERELGVCQGERSGLSKMIGFEQLIHARFEELMAAEMTTGSDG